MLTFFTLADASSTDILANVSGIFGDTWPILALVVGIPLGFWVITKIMGIFAADRKKREKEDAFVTGVMKENSRIEREHLG